MKKVHIITTSRADFTIWLPIINKFISNNNFDIKVIVCGTHYMNELGNTVEEVRRKIEKKYLIELENYEDNTNYNFLSDLFLKYNNLVAKKDMRPDLTLLLGDRYELLPILNCLIINRIPIGHLYPAECDISYCIDTQVRDAISRSAHLFFVPHKDYKHRLLAMGEEEWRIIVTGNTSNKDIVESKIDLIDEFLKSKGVNFDFSTSLVNCCYHPPTWKEGYWKKELPQILASLEEIEEGNIFIWTGINSDPDSFEMKEYLLNELKKKDNHFYFDSLGGEIYHSLLRKATFTIGNSSSGLYEAPIYKCPSINVGVRQGGRLHAKSVISVAANKTEILKAIRKIDKLNLSNFENPYYNEKYPENLIEHIQRFINNPNLMLKKLNVSSLYELERVPDYL